jgi:ABC-type nitrate/sulfonate/bicarbonate transport system permease component
MTGEPAERRIRLALGGLIALAGFVYYTFRTQPCTDAVDIVIPTVAASALLFLIIKAHFDRREEGGVASRLVQVLFILLFFGFWYVGTTRWGISPILLPNPVAVYGELNNVLCSLEFVGDLGVTLSELGIAFAISSTLGITLGYLISRSQYSIRVFEPLFAGVYSVPIILFLPLYILFFGLGPPSKIALGATISFFPIVLNTIAGFGYVDRIYILSARSMGASDLQLFRHVLLPAALPVVLTGLRIGFTVALLSILGSETIASLSGLGHRIVHLAEGMDTARMFAYIAFAVVIALILNTITSTLEARARRR